MKEKDFLEKAAAKHGEKYRYDTVKFINGHSKISIICLVHGIFWQTPHKHLSNGGCRKCGIAERASKRKKDTAWFIKQAIKVHGDKFDYSESEYVKSKDLIIIKCKNGHTFKQSPNTHLSGHGCSFCQRIGKPYWDNLPKMKFNEFVKISSRAHNDQYDYKKTEETFIEGNVNKKVLITCKIHGDFWQQVKSHMGGSCGCKRCHKKWRKEHQLLDYVRNLLPGITVLHQYSPSWLGRQVFDIYIPDYNIAIEYNGEQHYLPVEIYGGLRSLVGQTEMDNKKRMKAIENGCELYEIPFFYSQQQIEEKLSEIKNRLLS